MLGALRPGTDDRCVMQQAPKPFASAGAAAASPVAPTCVDPHVVAVAPPQLLQPLQESRDEVCPTGASARGMSTPMRRMRSLCCARSPSGHAATAPPSTVMNSRRLFRDVLYGSAEDLVRLKMSRGAMQAVAPSAMSVTQTSTVIYIALGARDRP